MKTEKQIKERIKKLNKLQWIEEDTVRETIREEAILALKWVLNNED